MLEGHVPVSVLSKELWHSFCFGFSTSDITFSHNSSSLCVVGQVLECCVLVAVINLRNRTGRIGANQSFSIPQVSFARSEPQIPRYKRRKVSESKSSALEPFHFVCQHMISS